MKGSAFPNCPPPFHSRSELIINHKSWGIESWAKSIENLTRCGVRSHTLEAISSAQLEQLIRVHSGWTCPPSSSWASHLFTLLLEWPDHSWFSFNESVILQTFDNIALPEQYIDGWLSWQLLERLLISGCSCDCLQYVLEHLQSWLLATRRPHWVAPLMNTTSALRCRVASRIPKNV